MACPRCGLKLDATPTAMNDESGRSGGVHARNDGVAVVTGGLPPGNPTENPASPTIRPPYFVETDSYWLLGPRKWDRDEKSNEGSFTFETLSDDPIFIHPWPKAGATWEEAKAEAVAEMRALGFTVEDTFDDETVSDEALVRSKLVCENHFVCWLFSFNLIWCCSLVISLLCFVESFWLLC